MKILNTIFSVLLMFGLNLAFGQQSGILIITEIMQNPAAVGDADGEYFELYNNTGSPIDLIGYVINDADGETDTIATSVIVAPADYVVLGRNADMSTNGGVSVDYEYMGIALANGADEIIIVAPNGTEVDRVEYDGGATFPDPTGASMNLNPNNLDEIDNDSGANWCESTSTYGDGDLGTPGLANDMCSMDCVINNVFVNNDGCQDSDYIFDVNFSAAFSNNDFEVVDVTNNALLAVGTSSPITVTLSNNTSNTPFDIAVRDAVDNSCISATFTVTPINCSLTCTSDLVITAVFDGPLASGTPKGVELYVLNNIADLSIYGISSANNGGGATGSPEFSFPADAATAGDYIYVASETDNFTAFFGFAPDYTSGALGVNGDDAIELFCGSNVIDVFGDVDTDGSGEPWEYADGWAYRVDCTGPDGSTFQVNNWTYSGPDALDGETTNATAATPVPIGTYSVTSCGNCEADLDDPDLGGGDPSNIPAGTYQASNSISSTGTVATGTTVVFDAGVIVVLSAGFQAESGSTFTAMIGGCTPSLTQAVEERSAKAVSPEAIVNIHPNPINQNGTIALDLSTTKRVSIQLFNLAGQQVQVLLNEQELLEGKHQIPFQINRLNAGTYFARVQIGQQVQMKKVMVME